jgi:acyl-CoA thioester hydrolase
MAYYNVLFDKAVDHVFELLGCGPGYLAERNLSFFTAEAHVCYVANSSPTPGSGANPASLDFDAKRLHLFQEIRMWTAGCRRPRETLLLHIDMSGPSDNADARRRHRQGHRMADAHRDLPRAERAGRSMRYRAQTHRADRMTHAAKSFAHAWTHPAMGASQYQRLSRTSSAGDLAACRWSSACRWPGGDRFPAADRPRPALLARRHQRTGAHGRPATHRGT